MLDRAEKGGCISYPRRVFPLLLGIVEQNKFVQFLVNLRSGLMNGIGVAGEMRKLLGRVWRVFLRREPVRGALEQMERAGIVRDLGDELDGARGTTAHHDRRTEFLTIGSRDLPPRSRILPTRGSNRMLKAHVRQDAVVLGNLLQIFKDFSLAGEWPRPVSF